MACERFSDALKDHALGVALPSAAAAHLAVCARCQAALERERALHETMAGIIAQVGRVEPAADFQVRLRQAAVGQSRVRTAVPKRVSMRVVWRYVVPLGLAASVSLAVGGPMLWRRPVPAEANRAGGADISLAVAASVMTNSAVVAAPREVEHLEPQVQRPATRRSRSRTVAAPASVVVAPGQIDAIGRLVARLSADDPMMARRILEFAGGPRPPAVDLPIERPSTLPAGASRAASDGLSLGASTPIVINDVVVPAIVVSEPFSAQ